MSWELTKVWFPMNNGDSWMVSQSLHVVKTKVNVPTMRSHGRSRSMNGCFRECKKNGWSKSMNGCSQQMTQGIQRFVDDQDL